MVLDAAEGVATAMLLVSASFDSSDGNTRLRAPLRRTNGFSGRISYFAEHKQLYGLDSANRIDFVPEAEAAASVNGAARVSRIDHDMINVAWHRLRLSRQQAQSFHGDASTTTRRTMQHSMSVQPMPLFGRLRLSCAYVVGGLWLRYFVEKSSERVGGSNLLLAGRISPFTAHCVGHLDSGDMVAISI
ncbi:hypothetical protein VDGL01_02619 [Verticillium dahliae]